MAEPGRRPSCLEPVHALTLHRNVSQVFGASAMKDAIQSLKVVVLGVPQGGAHC